jgi:hypothetical protein
LRFDGALSWLKFVARVEVFKIVENRFKIVLKRCDKIAGQKVIGD